MRISSRGDAIVVIVDRATTPASRGLKVSEDMKGGSTELSRWSYVRIYAVDEGTPITLNEVGHVNRTYNREVSYSQCCSYTFPKPTQAFCAHYMPKGVENTIDTLRPQHAMLPYANHIRR